MDEHGIYRGPFGDLKWNQPGRTTTVNYLAGRGWRYTRAMHETKWRDPSNPGRILANHIIVMSCPYPYDRRVVPELRVCSVGGDVPWGDVRIQCTAWSPIEDGVCAVVYRCPCKGDPCQQVNFPPNGFGLRDMIDTPDLPAVRWAMVTEGHRASITLPEVFVLIMPAETPEGPTGVPAMMPNPGSASGK